MIVSAVRRLMLTLEVVVLFAAVVIEMRRHERQMEEFRAARRARFGMEEEIDD